MSKVQMLRALVEQRLAAAAEEIFGLFEGTIAEYEEELSRSKEENERQRRLLDAVFLPEVRIHRADVQQLLVRKEEVPSEQQDWSSSVDQVGETEPPHIKEDQEGQTEPPHITEDQEGPETPHIKEDISTSQQGEQLQGLDEADIKYPLTLVPVKSEEDDDEEKPQSSGLPSAAANSSPEHMETEADEEDCGGPVPVRNSHSYLQPDTKGKAGNCTENDDSAEWQRTREPLSNLKALKNDAVPDGVFRPSPGVKPYRCTECRKTFRTNRDLENHIRTHTGERPFSCSVCKKSFTYRPNLRLHIRTHTGEKPFSCSVCKKSFTQRPNLQVHMRTHTGEKPFSCSVCKKSFTRKDTLQLHIRTHTGEKPFSCSICERSFTQKTTLQLHIRTHTGEKPFGCSFCKKSFTQKTTLQLHIRTHTGEKPFSCSICEKSFSDGRNLKSHIRTHTGENQRRRLPAGGKTTSAMKPS